MKNANACLVCGEELEYFTQSRQLECVFCRERFAANAACKNGHYVCDRCHAQQAVERITRMSRETRSSDPLEIAAEMMRDPYVHMHGPENHVLVGAALLAAYKNAGGAVELEPALRELAERGGQVPGGACGFWGCCGAAVSAGIFASLVTGSTPMAREAFGLSNQMTSSALAAIGEVGGPRCCKRNAFLAIGRAAAFCRERLGVEMDMPQSFHCEFSARNHECLGRRCPFHAVRGQGADA